MYEIEIERYGRVLAGENEGYFIHVHYDPENTGGYYIFLLDDVENPSDGGDYWAKDIAEVRTLFKTCEWSVEWRT